MASRAERYSEKSIVINFRIQPSTKAALQKAAAANRRTLSAEAEFQLRRSLSDMGAGRPTHALMNTIALAIDGLVGLRSPRARWWKDSHLFDQAAKLAAAAFEMLRPPGPPPESAEPLGERSARFAIEATLREIQTVDPSIPFGEQTPYQRWLTLMKQDLGPLVDRAVIWGQGAEEARAQRDRAAPILPEYIRLSRKDAATPRNMTEAETQRLAQLRRELVETIGGTES